MHCARVIGRSQLREYHRMESPPLLPQIKPPAVHFPPWAVDCSCDNSLIKRRYASIADCNRTSKHAVPVLVRSCDITALTCNDIIWWSIEIWDPVLGIWHRPVYTSTIHRAPTASWEPPIPLWSCRPPSPSTSRLDGNCVWTRQVNLIWYARQSLKPNGVNDITESSRNWHPQLDTARWRRLVQGRCFVCLFTQPLCSININGFNLTRSRTCTRSFIAGCVAYVLLLFRCFASYFVLLLNAIRYNTTFYTGVVL